MLHRVIIFVKQNAGNINVTYVILAGHAGGKKMTVFEKIKIMNFEELAELFDKIQGAFEIINNLYCGFLCPNSKMESCGYPVTCPINGEPSLTCKAFLNMDYDEMWRLLNGKE